ncbi:UBA_like_SF and PTH2 domain-containing protein isoform X2 [Callorhinchus milii]|uniref:peptidyl-tRNA hydrolase n=2 Tax=Callorhinchus milii TaxID=7868 RepID=V9KUV7_CALMI|nr:UBA_like_SF and PTH2 domain-containing protein isoform X2 [Callorhinchus milii]XP_042195655.1 UBA_like_SF and PTH2 domain-containing protein isoform X2 [Callorhinchus milii]XP_042195656.1 UBA_like_SF and PTH2 domain-containing protein isoform X2 [Callorhinchus milii]
MTDTQVYQEVNPVFLQQLVDLGIPEKNAREALIVTENQSSDAAALYYFNEAQMPTEHCSQSCKMVFVVNTELCMGAGKMAAQVAHAAVGLYQTMTDEAAFWRLMLNKWDEEGAKKIVLKGRNYKHILELQEKAARLGLPQYLVQDAGRTQVAAGSCTVLSIMGEEVNVNQVTGDLQLL